MSDRNLLFFTLYIIIVLYVLYRAVKSVEDRVVIQQDEQSLKLQLESQNLQDLVAIRIPLGNQYKLDQLKELEINIENKSQQHTIYVEWDHSSLTDFDGRSRRIIRIIPGMTLDLFQFQVGSVITVGKTLKELFTAEDVLRRDLEAGSLKIAAPLFDLSKLKKGSGAQKKLFADFMARNSSLEFSVRLVLRVFELGTEKKPDRQPPIDKTLRDRTYVFSCDFKVKKLSWIESVSWKPK